MTARPAALAVLTALCALGATGAPAAGSDVEAGPAVGDAQLAPYFAAGPLRSALSELQAGRPERALRFVPANPPDAPAKWLKALVLKAAGRARPARLLFEQLALSGGPLADRALHLGALCAIDEGDGAAAERLLAQVSRSYVDADQAILERARQSMKAHVAGPSSAARIEEILRPIFTGEVRGDVASAHLLAGDAQAAAHDKEKARAHYRAAWVDRPLSPASDSARDRDRKLGPSGPIEPRLLVRRAEMLLDAHKNREALEQLARIPVQPLCSGGCPGDQIGRAHV